MIWALTYEFFSPTYCPENKDQVKEKGYCPGTGTKACWSNKIPETRKLRYWYWYHTNDQGNTYVRTMERDKISGKYCTVPLLYCIIGLFALLVKIERRKKIRMVIPTSWKTVSSTYVIFRIRTQLTSLDLITSDNFVTYVVFILLLTGFYWYYYSTVCQRKRGYHVRRHPTYGSYLG